MSKSKCEWCGKTDATVRVRLVRCPDVCMCEEDVPLCEECATDPDNADSISPD